MKTGITFEVLWNDADVLEVRISVSNGRFAGTTDVYVPTGGLEEAALKLDGFPRNTSDKRELLFGEFGSQIAGGAAKFRFYCEGGAGHARVEVSMESDWQRSEPESAHLHLRTEAAAVDTFVSELRQVHANLLGTAQLRSA